MSQAYYFQEASYHSTPYTNRYARLVLAKCMLISSGSPYSHSKVTFNTWIASWNSAKRWETWEGATTFGQDHIWGHIHHRIQYSRECMSMWGPLYWVKKHPRSENHCRAPTCRDQYRTRGQEPHSHPCRLGSPERTLFILEGGMRMHGINITWP